MVEPAAVNGKGPDSEGPTPSRTIGTGPLARAPLSDQEWLELVPGAPCQSCGREVYQLMEGQCLPCRNGRRDIKARRWERNQLVRNLRAQLKARR